MGADLYLMSLHEPTRRLWEPRFDAAAAERDRHEPGTPEHERWQKRVVKCYGKMYGAGYFRDPYNDLDVLWQLGLSYGATTFAGSSISRRSGLASKYPSHHGQTE